MAIIRTFSIKCDGCGKLFGGGENDNLQQLRESADAAGWWRVGNVGQYRIDRCPDCLRNELENHRRLNDKC